jgi:hypothetical protein
MDVKGSKLGRVTCNIAFVRASPCVMAPQTVAAAADKCHRRQHPTCDMSLHPNPSRSRLLPLLPCSLCCRPSALVKPGSRQLPLLLHTRSVTSAPAATSTAADACTEGCDGVISLLELVAGNEVGAIYTKLQSKRAGLWHSMCNGALPGWHNLDGIWFYCLAIQHHDTSACVEHLQPVGRA